MNNDAKIQVAKDTIAKILARHPDFTSIGVLTSRIGQDFQSEHPEGKSIKELGLPGVFEFMQTHMADDIILESDPANPIRVFAKKRSIVTGEQFQNIERYSLSTDSKGSNNRLPAKLFKLRGFLLTLSDEERAKFTLTGEMLLSIIRE